MEKIFLFLVLSVLLTGMFFAARKVIHDHSERENSKEGRDIGIQEYLSNQALGSFIGTGFVLSILIGCVLTWKVFFGAVLTAAVFILVWWLFFKKKRHVDR